MNDTTQQQTCPHLELTIDDSHAYWGGWVFGLACIACDKRLSDIAMLQEQYVIRRKDAAKHEGEVHGQ